MFSVALVFSLFFLLPYSLSYLWLELSSLVPAASGVNGKIMVTPSHKSTQLKNITISVSLSFPPSSVVFHALHLYSEWERGNVRSRLASIVGEDKRGCMCVCSHACVIADFREWHSVFLLLYGCCVVCPDPNLRAEGRISLCQHIHNLFVCVWSHVYYRLMGGKRQTRHSETAWNGKNKWVIVRDEQGVWCMRETTC